jgi:hypothetical protein
MNDARAEEALDPSLRTGVGNPLNPYNDELLSERDEKSVDDKGHKIVGEKLWSESGTGHYVWVALWTHSDKGVYWPTLEQLTLGGSGQTDIPLGIEEWYLSLGASKGKPRFGRPTVGACLEIPEDCYKDRFKSQYMAEWIANTAIEAMQERSFPQLGARAETLALDLDRAADHAIGSVL